MAGWRIRLRNDAAIDPAADPNLSTAEPQVHEQRQLDLNWLQDTLLVVSYDAESGYTFARPARSGSACRRWQARISDRQPRIAQVRIQAYVRVGGSISGAVKPLASAAPPKPPTAERG